MTSADSHPRSPQAEPVVPSEAADPSRHPGTAAGRIRDRVEIALERSRRSLHSAGTTIVGPLPIASLGRERHRQHLPDRRALLIGAGAGILVFALPRRALARPSLDEAVRAFTGGIEPVDGSVRLDIPPLLENGNAVGVTVEVESPMTAADHVRRIALFNEKNPQADVAIFHLGPRSGVARVSTRIRLATSQTVVAVAELSDGSFRASRESVIVTLAACIEDLS